MWLVFSMYNESNGMPAYYDFNGRKWVSEGDATYFDCPDESLALPATEDLDAQWIEI
jgi:hypothetical protein